MAVLISGLSISLAVLVVTLATAKRIHQCEDYHS